MKAAPIHNIHQLRLIRFSIYPFNLFQHSISLPPFPTVNLPLHLSQHVHLKTRMKIKSLRQLSIHFKHQYLFSQRRKFKELSKYLLSSPGVSHRRKLFTRKIFTENFALSAQIIMQDPRLPVASIARNCQNDDINATPLKFYVISNEISPHLHTSE